MLQLFGPIAASGASPEISTPNRVSHVWGGVGWGGVGWGLGPALLWGLICANVTRSHSEQPFHKCALSSSRTQGDLPY